MSVVDVEVDAGREGSVGLAHHVGGAAAAHSVGIDSRGDQHARWDALASGGLQAQNGFLEDAVAVVGGTGTCARVVAGVQQ